MLPVPLVKLRKKDLALIYNEIVENPSKLNLVKPQMLCQIVINQGLDVLQDFLPFLEKKNLNALVNLLCWKKDSVDFSNFNEILSLVLDSQELFFKFFNSIPITFFAVGFQEHVDFKILDEKEEFFDMHEAFTIDGGYTWIWFKTTNSDLQTLYRRCIDMLLMAPKSLFEVLYTIAGSHSLALLEIANQEKIRSLAYFGLPDEQHRKELLVGKELFVSYSSALETLPAIASDSPLEPLASIVDKLEYQSLQDLFFILTYAVCEELGLNFLDLETLQEAEEFVIGCCNIGAQKLLAAGNKTEDLIDLVTLKECFQYGLFDVLYFYQKFKRLEIKSSWDLAAQHLIERLQHFPPRLPEYVTTEGLLIDKTFLNFSSLKTVPISTLSHLKILKQLLRDIN